MNTKALEFFGISQKDIEHLSHEEKKLANLEEGHFSERGLIAVMPKIMNYLAAPERIIEGLQITESYIQEQGITLIANPGAMYDRGIQQAKNYVFGDSQTPLDLCIFQVLYICWKEWIKIIY